MSLAKNIIGRREWPNTLGIILVREGDANLWSLSDKSFYTNMRKYNAIKNLPEKPYIPKEGKK